MAAPSIEESDWDRHEHSRVSDPYRELASACIRDAAKCLEAAQAYRFRLPFLGSRQSRLDHPKQWTRYVHVARVYWHQLEVDVDWFRRADGYSLWVCATALSDEEAEAVRDEYLRRAEPLLDEYDEALLKWGRGGR